MTDDTLPDPDRIEGAPHPRDTPQVFGQRAAEAGFLAAFAADRLHSGWLLSGPRGIGKATLAYRIAAFLLAQPATSDAGLLGAPPPPATLDIAPDAPDLRLIRAGAHPRLFVLRRGPNDTGTRLSATISVERVRELKGFFQMSAADGGRRVVIVDSADEMNTSAANALLKSLEEPPARVTQLLIAHQPARLLPTIRSRCRELRLAPLGAADLAQALAAQGRAPDAAEALAVLAGGSVGDAIRLAQHDGLALYAGLVALLADLPRFDRPAALRLAESCAGKGAEVRFPLVLDLIDLLLARLARAGLQGPPDVQAAPREARLLARLAPDDRAARHWASLQQDLGQRARAGRAVNLDPAVLILDMLWRIEEAARSVAAA
ncbi:MAG: DNA polymerase III subunit delta' [Rhodobacterales bacterium]|nr:DNA polymerase III subunit delta' [Rhodobacterales bacterium]NCT13527.1 DNA polymerase III subunit delta' [Rhodobacterales bacterium]